MCSCPSFPSCIQLPTSHPLPSRVLQGGEDDIDALLAAFKLKDERHSKVEVQDNCAAPSPRVYASFTPIPSQVPGWLGGLPRWRAVLAAADAAGLSGTWGGAVGMQPGSEPAGITHLTRTCVDGICHCSTPPSRCRRRRTR